MRDRSGLETDVVLHAAPGAVPPPPPAMRLQRMLGLAFLGGLILNLMPCVFPVLAMKVVGLAGAARGRARLHAVAYTVGVLVAFAGLGAALLAARAAGAAAGWGFQFQSPVFVAAMAWLLFAVGLNLSGVFEIGTGLAGAGQGLRGMRGQLGSFFTGLLAVVVATPCTAPFMGVAIAAGLAAPPAVTMLVFLVMGLGLAAPYAVLAIVPALGRVAPRPGRWMEVLRQALAFPMYARERLAGVGDQPGGRAGRRAGHRGRPRAAGFRRLGAGDHAGRPPTGAAALGQSAAAAALLAALAVLSGIATAPAAPPAWSEAGAEPFSAARLAALRAEGRPVFVNMTAAWCVTCLVNERVAIGSEAVRRAFADRRRDVPEGRLDAAGPADHRLSARERPRRRAAVCLLPAARPAGRAAADPDREHAAGRVDPRLAPFLLLGRGRPDQLQRYIQLFRARSKSSSRDRELSLGLRGNDMSATTRDSVAIRSAPAISLALKRLLKMMIACGVLAAGVYAVWSAQAFVVSDNAVVSAYVTSLRAPIEGYVSGGRAQVGAEIGQGDILATVTNPRVDDQRLADLQERVQRLALEKAAIMRQHDTLEATWRELMQRAEDYRRAMLARLSGQLESTEKISEPGCRKASRPNANMHASRIWFARGQPR